MKDVDSRGESIKYTRKILLNLKDTFNDGLQAKKTEKKWDYIKLKVYVQQKEKKLKLRHPNGQEMLSAYNTLDKELISKIYKAIIKVKMKISNNSNKNTKKWGLV